ncbi:sensor histidine kinase [Micromonospora sp. NBC_01796]|uniref:sensor histidine kinase n=1 Tax=Micromonospora sp. NBC_01796 TaxID=2975987 RepID=UPI002DD8B16D|nr:histidine kinase [Micromonospora sp. NBC_01796]WSA82756.1 histidine kinase [Micromonospora sp. NBC_01796]
MCRSRAIVVDAAFAGAIFAACVPPLLVNNSPWWGYPLAAGTSLPLIWRRRVPFVVGVVVGVAAIGYARVPEMPQAMPYAVLVATYTIAERGTRWQRWTTLVAGPLGVLASTNSLPDALFSYQFPILLSLSAYGLGAAARTRRRYAEVLEDRARHLDRARDAETRQAAAAERERIAREMHDILAHAVSLMVVQAEAGPVVVRSDPARAEAAFEAIGQAGRRAMTQLRWLLRGVGDPVDGESRPCIANVPRLAGEVGRTGLAVSLTVAGEARQVSTEVDVAAYRIVQEALTNALRHADATTVSIRLLWGAGDVEVMVADDGHGLSVPSGRRPDVAATGRGLAGISVRAAACGGVATTGPGPGGRGFTVYAKLPAPVVPDPVVRKPRVEAQT